MMNWHLSLKNSLLTALQDLTPSYLLPHVVAISKVLFGYTIIRNFIKSLSIFNKSISI